MKRSDFLSLRELIIECAGYAGAIAIATSVVWGIAWLLDVVLAQNAQETIAGALVFPFAVGAILAPAKILRIRDEYQIPAFRGTWWRLQAFAIVWMVVLVAVALALEYALSKVGVLHRDTRPFEEIGLVLLGSAALAFVVSALPVRARP